MGKKFQYFYDMRSQPTVFRNKNLSGGYKFWVIFVTLQSEIIKNKTDE
jgi:hypothetical protein